MQSLTNIEKKRLEKALVMEGGTVLGFSNRTFAEFFRDTLDIDIYDQQYLRASGSKAHRMRAFWDEAHPQQLLKVLDALLEGWDVYADNCIGYDGSTVTAIAHRLRRDCLHSTVSSKPALTRVEDVKFSVALSFPGQCRGYVEQISVRLASSLGAGRVFYDRDYQAQLARPDLDTLLQRIYHDQSSLIVVFLSSDYATSEWCGLEWRAVRDIIKRKRSEQVMFVRFDDAAVDGALSIDGYIDARQYDAECVARFIVERVALAPIA